MVYQVCQVASHLGRVFSAWFLSIAGSLRYLRRVEIDWKGATPFLFPENAPICLSRNAKKEAKKKENEAFVNRARPQNYTIMSI